MKAKCPHCEDGYMKSSLPTRMDQMRCGQCDGTGFIEVNFAMGTVYTDACTKCGFENGGFIVGPDSPYKTLEKKGEPRPCIHCGGPVVYKEIGDSK